MPAFNEQDALRSRLLRRPPIEKHFFFFFFFFYAVLSFYRHSLSSLVSFNKRQHLFNIVRSEQEKRGLLLLTLAVILITGQFRAIKARSKNQSIKRWMYYKFFGFFFSSPSSFLVGIDICLDTYIPVLYHGSIFLVVRTTFGSTSA